MTVASFGNYLANVQERDIDLLLMEEFHVSPDFVAWFCDRVGIPPQHFDGAWHSVTDADGETDLLLRVSDGMKRTGVLIENKISAPEQSEQSARYHLRAARAQNEGHFEAFIICMCAPQTYLASLPADTMYQARVAYEEIAGWFGRFDDARSRWRRAIVEEAIVQGRRGYRMIVNETVSRFHMEFWEYLQDHHPELHMRRPTPKGSKSEWIQFRGHEFPKGIGFHLKMDQRVVELGFRRLTVTQLRDALGQPPAGVRVVQKGGTAAFAISIPTLDRTRSLADQAEPLKAAMAAVQRLLPYASVLQLGQAGVTSGAST